VLEPGRWRVDASTSSTYVRSSHVQECPDIGPPCDDGPVTPYRHRSTLFLVESRIEAERGIAPGFSASLTVPFRWAQLGIRNETLGGDPFPDPPDEGIHHRNETIFGPGDPVLALRAGRGVGGGAVAGTLGVSIPFGETRPNPFEAGENGERHQHFQFGAGILQPIVGVDALVPAGSAVLTANATGTLALYENRWGLRPSSRAQASIGAGHALGEKLFLAGRATVAREWPERWRDHQPEHEGNLGRTDILASGNLRWQARESISASAGVSLPLYTDAVGSKIDYPGTLMLGVSWSPAE
jgi:hypothetical protein